MNSDEIEIQAHFEYGRYCPEAVSRPWDTLETYKQDYWRRYAKFGMFQRFLHNKPMVTANQNRQINRLP